ncbi:MAG: hypothetical protein ACR2MD_04810 [Aridibacter sp.]
MKIKFNLKKIWSAVGIISLVLLAFHWFGFDSQQLEMSILALNVLALLLSLPCSLFVVPVIIAANQYLQLSPVSSDGLYLNTIFLFVVGAMQWFWIAKFWSPTEAPLQMLGLPNGKI